MITTIRFLRDAKLPGPGTPIPQPPGFPELILCNGWLLFSKGQTAKLQLKHFSNFLVEGIDFEFVDSN